MGLGEDWNRDQAREDVDEHVFPLYDEKQLKNRRLIMKTAYISIKCIVIHSFPGCSDGKESARNAGDPGLIPGLGRSPRGEHGNPLQIGRAHV